MGVIQDLYQKIRNRSVDVARNANSAINFVNSTSSIVPTIAKTAMRPITREIYDYGRGAALNIRQAANQFNQQHLNASRQFSGGMRPVDTSIDRSLSGFGTNIQRLTTRPLIGNRAQGVLDFGQDLIQDIPRVPLRAAIQIGNNVQGRSLYQPQGLRERIALGNQPVDRLEDRYEANRQFNQGVGIPTPIAGPLAIGMTAFGLGSDFSLGGGTKKQAGKAITAKIAKERSPIAIRQILKAMPGLRLNDDAIIGLSQQLARTTDSKAVATALRGAVSSPKIPVKPAPIRGNFGVLNDVDMQKLLRFNAYGDASRGLPPKEVANEAMDIVDRLKLHRFARPNAGLKEIVSEALTNPAKINQELARKGARYGDEAFGGIAGIEPELDEQGRPTGKLKFNEGKAAAGILGVGAIKRVNKLGATGDNRIFVKTEKSAKGQLVTPKGNLSATGGDGGLSKPFPIQPSVNQQVPTTTKLSEQPMGPSQYRPTSQVATRPNQDKGLISQKSTSLSESIPLSPDTAQYLNGLKQQQLANMSGKIANLKGRVGSFLRDAKAKLVDSVSPIEDVLYAAQKQGKFELLPKKDVSLQIDRVLRARNLAGQFAKDNGIEQVIREAPDLDALNQYLIAKQASRVSEFGIETGRDIAKDKRLVAELANIYEPFAKTVTNYNRKLLDYAVDSGLVARETAEMLKKKYPDYVPLNRVFTESEQELRRPMGQGTRQVASIGRQTVVQKLKGSERDIVNPIESILGRTVDAFEQGEKNKAAQTLADYMGLPGNPLALRKLPGDVKTEGKAVISLFRNGVKEIYETTPEIAEAAKRMNKQQIGLLGQIAGSFTRVLKLGATGLNIPFIARNLVKDQQTAFIQSNRAAKTSMMNPANFVRALWSALSHDELYNDLVRNAGGGTSFDIARDAAVPTIGKIRASRNLPSKALYTVTRPSELLRAAEDIIGRSEELTRVQQYKGTLDALLKEGRTLEDAKLLAAKAARENTVNFHRSGDWGTVLNVVIPYLNAGIQGARVTVRNMAQRPVQTGLKLATTMFLPTATVTAWNLSDPERRTAYEDIPDYEKENNFIIVPPNPTQDEKGRWNVIKIPLAQGTSGLNSVVRQSMESAYGIDPVKFADIANALTKTTTSFELNQNKLISQFTPQAIKPFVESYTNTNLFTGAPIVPRSLQYLPPALQAKEDTSGTARIIGNALNVSPLKVQNFIGTATGGVGKQALNASDRALASAGVIPEQQIGGQGVIEDLVNSFAKAKGGEKVSQFYDQKDKEDQLKAIQRELGKGNISPEVAFREAARLQDTGGAIGFPKAKAADVETYAEAYGLDIAEAELELAKENFKKSDEVTRVVGDNILRKDRNGGVSVESKDAYDFKLNTNKMQRVKAAEDYGAWTKLAEEQLALIEKQLQDPSLDELEQSDLFEKAENLLEDMAKYQGYGGRFTKPKKPKQPPKMPSVSIGNASTGTPKIAVKRPSVSRTTLRRRSRKIKILGAR